MEAEPGKVEELDKLWEWPKEVLNTKELSFFIFLSLCLSVCLSISLSLSLSLSLSFFAMAPSLIETNQPFYSDLIFAKGIVYSGIAQRFLFILACLRIVFRHTKNIHAPGGIFF